jgi:hypothetical protein
VGDRSDGVVYVGDVVLIGQPLTQNAATTTPTFLKIDRE